MRPGPGRTREADPSGTVTKLSLSYWRELHAKAFSEERADYFFRIGLEVRFCKCHLWPDPIKHIFVLLLSARPGLKAQGGGSAVSKSKAKWVFCRLKIFPLRVG